MHLPAVFHTAKGRVALVLTGSAIATLLLLSHDALTIETLLVIWNVALFIGIMIWEREKREKIANGQLSFSDDERWTKIKKKIETLDQKLDKTKDADDKRALVNQKRWLENELRRVEWSIKESNLNGIYNANSGNMKRSDGRNRMRKSDEPLSSEERADLERRRDYDPEAAALLRKELEREVQERKSLERILDNAEAVVNLEPASSLAVALKPVANDFKAHYNAIKKRRGNSPSLSDYWVAWAVLLSITNDQGVDQGISKYCSKDFRPRMIKFLKVVDSLRLSKDPSGERQNMTSEESSGLKSKIEENLKKGSEEGFGSQSDSD